MVWTYIRHWSAGVGIGAAICLGAASIGCNIETTPVGDEEASGDVEEDDTQGWHVRPEIEERFVEEAYGVGASWFDYDMTTHAITPKPKVYRLDLSQHTAVLFNVESYYDDRGTSGNFRLGLQWVDMAHDSANGVPRTLALSSNIKEGPVCVSLADEAEVACDSGRQQLVFRVSSRQVAAAGFAVANPTILNAMHFTDPDAAKIQQGNFATLQAASDAIADAKAWQALPDARVAPNDAVLTALLQSLDTEGSPAVLLQATAGMQLVGWTLKPQAQAGTFEFFAHCVPLAQTLEAQLVPRLAEAQRRVLSFDAGQVSLVRLCADSGPEIVESSATPYRGLWPESFAFDLVVDTLGDSVLIRLAPGHLIWSSGAAEISEQTAIPVGLWQD